MKEEVSITLEQWGDHVVITESGWFPKSKLRPGHRPSFDNHLTGPRITPACGTTTPAYCLWPPSWYLVTCKKCIATLPPWKRLLRRPLQLWHWLRNNCS